MHQITALPTALAALPVRKKGVFMRQITALPTALPLPYRALPLPYQKRL